jgi:hypothetical protein
MRTADTPSTAVSARVELGAAGCAVAGGIVAAAAGPLVTFGVLGVLLGLGVFAVTAYRPVFATYAYLGTLPIVAGIDSGNLIPLVRPNEALLVLLLAGAIFGGYLRYCRGSGVPFRRHRLDIPLAAFVLLSTVWPLASPALLGQRPLIGDVVAVVPICTSVAIYLLVRFTVATEVQLLRCLRLIVWPGAVVAILQTLQFGPLLASPIATGDYFVICLVLVLCCGARGLLDRRERLALSLVLGAGVLAAGQLSTWISAAVAVVLISWRLPDLRRDAVRFPWVVPIAFAVGAAVLIGRLEGFAGLGVPITGLGGWADLLWADLRWADLRWLGGLLLLVAFGWLSVAVLRRARELSNRPGAVGATAVALEICWWFLLVLTVLDPHLTVRNTGDLLFMLLAITTGRLCVARYEVERQS